MKTFKNLVFTAVLSTFGILTATAQLTNTATANASATIVQDLTIEKTNDLNFGVVIPSSSASSFILAPAGGLTISVGSVSQILGDQTAASPEAAAFEVTGSGISIFTISLPTSIDITNTNDDTMTVDTFTSSLPVAGVTLGGVLGDLSVTEDFTVGAKLNVGADQAAGLYTGTFDVTVNYL
jgi:spore coat protein U-like protein